MNAEEQEQDNHSETPQSETLPEGGGEPWHEIRDGIAEIKTRLTTLEERQLSISQAIRSIGEVPTKAAEGTEEAMTEAVQEVEAAATAANQAEEEAAEAVEEATEAVQEAVERREEHHEILRRNRWL